MYVVLVVVVVEDEVDRRKTLFIVRADICIGTRLIQKYRA